MLRAAAALGASGLVSCGGGSRVGTTSHGNVGTTTAGDPAGEGGGASTPAATSGATASPDDAGTSSFVAEGGRGAEGSGGAEGGSEPSGAGGVMQSGGASAVTTTGGSAASLPSEEEQIAEVCSRACQRTGSLSLPHVLCEDWQLPFRADGGLRLYEFCDPLPMGGDCSSSCESAFAQSSEACAATLAPVVDCVGVFGPYPEPTAAASCLFTPCVNALLDMTSECAGLRQELETARATWTAAGVTAYRFDYEGSTIAVADGVARVEEGTALSNPPTVEELFERIEEYLDVPGIAAISQYDEALGYPTVIDLRGDVSSASCTFSDVVTVEDLQVE